MNQNILKINGQYVKFYVTTNATLPAILKNTGDAVVHHDVNTQYNSIWLGGELIAGGWGFVKKTHDVLEGIADRYYKDYKYLDTKENEDIKKLNDIYAQIIYGVDHDKWNLNNYLQKSGEYADASDTYILTSLVHLGTNNSKVRIKLSQLPLLLRKQEYKDIEFYDIKYRITYKHALKSIKETIETTSNHIELPVNSTLVSIVVSFSVRFNDAEGINNLTLGINQYNKTLNSYTHNNNIYNEVTYADTSFSRILEYSKFNEIDSNDVQNIEDINNMNSYNVFYNIDNASNTIYYSNQTENKKNIKYYVTLNYADTKDVENAIYYEVLEGKQKVLSIDADIIGTSDENLKVIDKLDEDVLYDTINKIQDHEANISNLYITGYNVMHVIKSEEPISIVNEHLQTSEKVKVGEQMDITVYPNQGEYIYLVIPAEYILKGVYRLNNDKQEFNYTGYFANVPNTLGQEQDVWITNNPYKYINALFYSSIKAKVYVINAADHFDNSIIFRIYTEYDESLKENERVSSSFSTEEQNYNTITNELDTLLTIPDENFNETHWLDINKETYDWEEISRFLSNLNNADKT